MSTAARELFNAVCDAHYGPETPIIITTLDDAVYRDIKNDLSFTIGDVYMALFEQQSSRSRNLSLRILLYIAHVYERIIPNKDVHSDRLLKVPRPHPVVIYTGRDSEKSAMDKDHVILRLSDTFNITSGHNEDLLRRSPLLRGYMDFITWLWK